MKGIFEGVSHIHKCGFLHWDIKPENMMLVGDRFKLVDFGTVKNISWEKERIEKGEISKLMLTDYVSTRWYRSPECILKVSDYGTPVDVFALGCVIAEMFWLRPLFHGVNAID